MKSSFLILFQGDPVRNKTTKDPAMRVLSHRYAGNLSMLKSVGYQCQLYGTGPLVPTGHFEPCPCSLPLPWRMGFCKEVNLHRCCGIEGCQRDGRKQGCSAGLRASSQTGPAKTGPLQHYCVLFQDSPLNNFCPF